MVICSINIDLMEDLSTIDVLKFKIIEKIGEGSFGEVFKVKEKQSEIIYAAKVSLKPFDEETILLISREVNILSRIIHPCIVRFIGFSSTNFHHEAKPVIITEFLSNGSLQDIISLERRSLAKFEWNNTRKLISIYGIASSLLYLHQHDIIHRDLKPANILMDDFLCPRIGDFGLSKVQHLKSSDNTIDSTLEIKGTPPYIAPEIWMSMKYSPLSDVYSFGIIVYEIISLEEPFKNFDIFQIRSKVINGYRPTINKYVPEQYKSLIERCWSQDPLARPTFDEIVELLKTEEFTSELLDKEDFLDYVEYVDNYKTYFDSKKQIIPIDKFIKRKTKTFSKISIKNDQTVKKKKSIYPLKEYAKLSEECKEMVDEAEFDADKQFEVGICLIEGKRNFPISTELGIKFLEKAISNESIDAAIYYSRMLIKAELVPLDLVKAEEILNLFSLDDSSEIPLLLGLIKKKEGDFMNAKIFFELASKAGNGEGQYENAKLIYKGICCSEDKKQAIKLFEMAKKNGFNKSDNFLSKQETTNSQRNKNLLLIEKDKVPIDDRDAKSLYEKGKKYYNGDGIEMDKSEAAHYFKMAADKGDSKAMYNYAVMLYNGEGIKENKPEAAHYLKKAADKGECEAMYNYAVMLYNGEGIEANKLAAAHYYKMAADKGNSKAMYNYAIMLYNGECIKENKLAAAHYYKMAADKGECEAMYNYALMLDNGEGIEENKPEADRYYEMAAEKGCKKANRHLFRLNIFEKIIIIFFLSILVKIFL